MLEGARSTQNSNNKQNRTTRNVRAVGRGEERSVGEGKRVLGGGEEEEVKKDK